MSELLRDPLASIALTLAVWLAASALHRRTGVALLHPVLVSMATLLAILPALGISFDAYAAATAPISLPRWPSAKSSSPKFSAATACLPMPDRDRGQGGRSSAASSAAAGITAISC